MVNLVHAKREQILRLARRHGVTRIRVFGSMARGDAGPQSDIDPAHRGWRGAEPVVSRRAGRGTGGASWPPRPSGDERGLDELLRDRVLEEAIPL